MQMIEPSYITGEMSTDFEEAVRLGAELGVHAVSLRSAILGRNIEALSNGDVQRVREILAKHNSRVSMLLSPVGKCNIEDPTEVDRHTAIFGRMVELAHLFETPLIRTFPFRRPGYTEYESSHLNEYLDRVVEKLGPIIEIAERGNVVVCLEWVGSTLVHTSQEVRQVLDALGNPNVLKLIWEVDVSSKAGESPTEGYPFVRGLVEDVHIKPNASQQMDPVGDGSDSYENALRLLLADGYAGYTTIEHWGSQEGILNGIRQLKTLLNKLHKEVPSAD